MNPFNPILMPPSSGAVLEGVLAPAGATTAVAWLALGCLAAALAVVLLAVAARWSRRRLARAIPRSVHPTLPAAAHSLERAV